MTAGTGNAVIRAGCPPGYTAMHRPRPTTGSGLAFIFKNTIDVQRLDEIVTDSFESLHLLVATRRTSQTFQMLIVYRPPSTPAQRFMSEFSSAVKPILASDRRVLFISDFNLLVTYSRINIEHDIEHLFYFKSIEKSDSSMQYSNIKLLFPFPSMYRCYVFINV